ncbi:MAG TPA: 30S ribosomal protein S13 [Thermoplasmata archaeon]|nr:30S ribosomal protein S13 [Thermoplasmata archaeon]
MSPAPKTPPNPEADPKAAEPPAEAEAEPKGGRKEKGGKGKDGEGKSKGKAPRAGAGGAPSGKRAAKPIPDNPNFRYIVRLAGSDLDGRRPTAMALTGVRGIGRRVATVACHLANVNPSEMIGNLPESTVDGIETVLGGLATGLPPWMLNHPTDSTTGETHHYVSADLETARRDDVNRMKMIRSYRGVRHERGQKVRGQRTRSNGRTGMAAGVLKKAAKEAAAAKSKEEATPAAAAAPAPAAPAKAGKTAEKKE